jgi:hypothetical protein
MGLDRLSVSLDRDESRFRAKVIYVSDRDDLAVISIKAKGIPLFKLGGLTYEGQHVLSLGYPGVRGEGLVYQAAEGVVSNKCFKEDLDNGSCLIQHTATIDHGNSGGPLVDAGTGQVVGVNTYGFRRSTSIAYVSIPADHVAKVLEKADEVHAKGEDKDWRRRQLLTTVQEFLDEQSSAAANSEHMSYLVSSRLVVRSGMDNYRAWKNSSKEFLVGFFGLITVVAKVTEIRIGEDIAKACEGKAEKVRLNSTDVRLGTHNKARVIVRCGSVQREMQWTYEYGRWQIVDYFSKTMDKEDDKLAVEREADAIISGVAEELGGVELECARGKEAACDEALKLKGVLRQEKLIRRLAVEGTACAETQDEEVCERADETKKEIFENAEAYAKQEKARQEAAAKAEAEAAAEAKAKAEAEAKAKAEADAVAKAEADARARIEQERLEAKIRAEYAAKDKAEAEAKAKAEAEAKARATAKPKAKTAPPPPAQKPAEPSKPPPVASCDGVNEDPPGCNQCPCPEPDKS